MFPLRWNFPFRKKDGSMTTVEEAISSGGSSYELPTASANTKGGVKIGSGLSMSGETLNNSNPTPYSLPTASAEVLGGIKVGSGLSIADGVLSALASGGGHAFLVTINGFTGVEYALIITSQETISDTASMWNALKAGVGNGIGIPYRVSSGAQSYIVTSFNVMTNGMVAAQYANFSISNDAIEIVAGSGSFGTSGITMSSCTKIF